MEFTNRVAIVTGASGGIGRAVARELVGRGTRVALVARSAVKLEEMATELGRDRTATFAIDVTDREAVTGLPGRVMEKWHRLDFVINNAGVNHRGPVIERTTEELAAILDTNLVAPVLLTHASLSLIAPDGVIVNVASLAGKVPVPHEAVYSGSKSGLRAFARALDTELLLDGRSVRVTTVCPGPVDTAFIDQDLTRAPDLIFSQPMSTAEDISRAVVALIEHRRQEIAVPSASGKLATLSYLSPRLFSAIRPVLEKVGARRKARYRAMLAARRDVR